MGLWQWLTGRKPRAAKPAVRARVDTSVPRARPSSRPRSRATRRSEYLPREAEERSFVLGADGMPTGYLRRHGDRWILFTDDGAGMVNPASARLYSLGLYCFRIRGVGYHQEAVTSGNFRPGSRVRLVREPDNEHDANAVAVHAGRSAEPGGYVNKMNAKRLAKRLDAGEELAAISVRGGGPGEDSVAPWILVATPDVLAHLRRNRR